MSHDYGQTNPTISIYQNADHVAGILQQVHGQPLLHAEQREQDSREGRSRRRERRGQAESKGSGGLPGFGSFGVRLSGEGSRTLSDDSTVGAKIVQNFAYSQAYYLYQVRAALEARKSIKQLSSLEEAERLTVGDFVEYTAVFRANELTALLDILSPDLIAEITRYKTRTDGIAKFDGFDNFEATKVFAEKIHATAEARADLAHAIAEAVRVDFRAEKTREYYGAVTDAQDLTVITLCDVAHFVVDDEDRVLDGHWTVLGKVTSPLADDLPVLERNKILDRMNPDAVDAVFKELREAAGQQTTHLPGEATDAYDNMFDLAFSSRVSGKSLRVVPIAIYA